MKRFLLTTFAAIAMAIPAFTETPVYLDDSYPIEQRIEDALSRMTLQEKNQHYPCAVKIQCARRSSSWNTGTLVYRRADGYPSRSEMGRMGPGEMEQ